MFLYHSWTRAKYKFNSQVTYILLNILRLRYNVSCVSVNILWKIPRLFETIKNIYLMIEAKLLVAYLFGTCPLLWTNFLWVFVVEQDRQYIPVM